MQMAIEDALNISDQIRLSEERASRGLCPGCGRLWQLVVGKIVKVEPTPPEASKKLADELRLARIFRDAYICRRCAAKFQSEEMQELVLFGHSELASP